MLAVADQMSLPRCVACNSGNFARKLQAISFVPVERLGSGLAADGGGGGSSGLSAAVPSGEGIASSMRGSSTVLVSFSEAAVPKDRHLVWSVIGVIPADLVPPQMMWSSIGIQTPPGIDVVLRHFSNLINTDSGTLEHWPYPESATTVFQTIYGYLDEHWDRVSPRVKASLQDTPCVPIGLSLVKASRLYFRMADNLAPFMFEVPRAFGSHDRLLKELGAMQSPTVQDYAMLLAELHSECAGQPLNPNELVAVLKVGPSRLFCMYSSDPFTPIIHYSHPPFRRRPCGIWQRFARGGLEKGGLVGTHHSLFRTITQSFARPPPAFSTTLPGCGGGWMPSSFAWCIPASSSVYAGALESSESVSVWRRFSSQASSPRRVLRRRTWRHRALPRHLPLGN